jgi:hypothetical protein
MMQMQPARALIYDTKRQGEIASPGDRRYRYLGISGDQGMPPLTGMSKSMGGRQPEAGWKP